MTTILLSIFTTAKYEYDKYENLGGKLAADHSYLLSYSNYNWVNKACAEYCV